jgi:hypothetical protein
MWGTFFSFLENYLINKIESTAGHPDQLGWINQALNLIALVGSAKLEAYAVPKLAGWIESAAGNPLEHTLVELAVKAIEKNGGEIGKILTAADAEATALGAKVEANAAAIVTLQEGHAANVAALSQLTEQREIAATDLVGVQDALVRHEQAIDDLASVAPAQPEQAAEAPERPAEETREEPAHLGIVPPQEQIAVDPEPGKPPTTTITSTTPGLGTTPAPETPPTVEPAPAVDEFAVQPPTEPLVNMSVHTGEVIEPKPETPPGQPE